LPDKKQQTVNYFDINKQQADAILLHNFLDKNQLVALESYKKYLDIPLILSLDDLLTEIPNYNPFSKTNLEDVEDNLKGALSLVDRLIVSTDYLASHFSSLHNDIRVINNYLPKSLWSNLKSTPNQSRRVRIGWAGAAQHEKDLAWLEPAIKATHKQLQWVFYGYAPANINPQWIEFHPNTSLAEYHTKLASLSLDIAIAPLTNNSFNKAKSNLKLLEYGALGLATICSDITPYQNSPAIKLNNDPELWIQTINKLSQSTNDRVSLGDKMKQWVHANYFLEDHLDEWRSALFIED
jgi:hypothetical protein